MNNLIIFAHPNLTGSTANSKIIENLKASKLDFKIRHLDSLYDSYKIDISAEQQELTNADNIIFQFPFYWYSCPASLKNWIDQVLTFNFAYGPEGDKLKGKNLILSFTVGGPAESYTPLGYNHFSVPDLVKPFEQTAYLCQMNYLPPIFTHRMIYIPGVYNIKEEVEERASLHAEKLITLLRSLAINA